MSWPYSSSAGSVPWSEKKCITIRVNHVPIHGANENFSEVSSSRNITQPNQSILCSADLVLNQQKNKRNCKSNMPMTHWKLLVLLPVPCGSPQSFSTGSRNNSDEFNDFWNELAVPHGPLLYIPQSCGWTIYWCFFTYNSMRNFAMLICNSCNFIDPGHYQTPSNLLEAY